MELNHLLEIDSNIRFTSLFKKSLAHCRNITKVHVVYCTLKFVVGIILSIVSMSGTCNIWEEINLWLVFVIIQSTMGFMCYYALLKFMKNVGIILKVAEDLHQAVYVNEEFQPLTEDEFLVSTNADPTLELSAAEESRRTQLLATQIKAEVSNKNMELKWSGHLAFLFNQALIIWGFVLEFTQPKSTLESQFNQCKGGLFIFLFIFLLLSVYQYLDIYILLVLVLVCLPFILVFLLYQKIKQRNSQKHAVDEVNKILDKGTVKYSPDLQGDPECRICFSAYNLGEDIVVLPCNNLHHFHKNCLKAWIQVSQSCPMCRKQLIEQEEMMEV